LTANLFNYWFALRRRNPAQFANSTLNSNAQSESLWPHRFAVVLVCVTFPLIWVGGLVTTYDAGMAVPDWPSTYGYNLFLYPWTTWLAGPWDLFIEHGHRLLGALAGLITIALVIVVCRNESRRWVQWLTIAALILVISQGLLGGARVIQDARQLAKIHGCLGPAFFALATAISVVTSSAWKRGPLVKDAANARSLHRVALFTAVLAYVQLVFGANLRHIPVTADVGQFRVALFFHLAGAAAVALHVIVLTLMVFRRVRTITALRRPVCLLVLIVLMQITLGFASWVVKYATPNGFEGWLGQGGFVIEADGLLQALTVTAHMAGGSLILAISVLLALRAVRLAPSGMESTASFLTTSSRLTESTA
jgi:cytochrome c oxidase assembly protein subunit 15